MFCGMGMYVIGIPLGSVLILYVNKHLLFPNEDTSSKDDDELQRSNKATIFAEIYGALFVAYEPKYWFFEGIVMIQKALLTGGLVLVAPGSSAQILVGLVVALVFFTILLRTQPYEDATEDNLQSIATASTVATLLIGFVLKVSTNSDNFEEEYESLLMDIILIGLFGMVGVIGFYMTVSAMPCFAGGGGKEQVAAVEEVEEEETKEKVKDEEAPPRLTADTDIIYSTKDRNLNGSFSRSNAAAAAAVLGNQERMRETRTRLQAKLRQSALRNMRLSELTLAHKQHHGNPEVQARISNMRRQRKSVETTWDVASTHSRKHKHKLQKRNMESNERLQRRLSKRNEQPIRRLYDGRYHI